MNNIYVCQDCGWRGNKLDLVEDKPHHWIGVCPHCGRNARILETSGALAEKTEVVEIVVG